MAKGFNENDKRIVEMINEHGPMSKSDAHHYGMKATTFQNHAKKLVALGILEESKGTSIGKGAPKVLYDLKRD